MENGVMSHLRMNLNNPILDEEKRGDELAQLVEYFCKNRGRHKLYGHQYIYVTIFFCTSATYIFLNECSVNYITFEFQNFKLWLKLMYNIQRDHCSKDPNGLR